MKHVLRRCLPIATLALFLGTATAQDKRVIVLAFDGADHGLTQEFMDQGHLPNLKALAESGSYSRLETTNPAESAVSWSSFGRGLNPGNTNLHGFVSRKPGSYFPELRFMMPGTELFSKAYASDFAEFAKGYSDALAEYGGELEVHEATYAQLVENYELLAEQHREYANSAAEFKAAFEAWKESPTKPTWWLPVAGFAGGLVIGLMFAAVLKAGGVIALVLGFVLGGIGAFIASNFGGSNADNIPTAPPDRVPTLLQVVEGKPLWHRLDDASVRGKGFLLPMSTPIEPLEHGKLLGGLGVPDIGGSTGTYFIFSTVKEDFSSGDERGTRSAGKVLRLKEDGSGGYSAMLRGPKDVDRQQRVKDRIAELAATPGEELDALEAEDAAGYTAELELTVKRSGDDAVTVEVDGQSATVATGEWSPLLPVTFPIPYFPVGALVRFRVLDAGDDIRLFFTPLGYDPKRVPPHMKIEQPPGFAKDIADAVGMFDTTGWACITNPLKDMEIGEDVFLEHIAKLTEERSKAVYHELGKDDWDFFFAMFGETDRVQHLMYRLIDEDSPMYERELAAKYSSAVLDAYKDMDAIVGKVVNDHVDENTQLFVISDHGFTSFRRQMSINAWLLEEGYLKPRIGSQDPAKLAQTLPSSQQDFLLYMDPAKSRAFSLGLGKIYINRAGREQRGIVRDADYDELCEEIKQKLLALRDPQNGARVIDSVLRHDEVYTGEYADDDADLYIGFAEYYRVSWSTTSGGFSAAVIEDNDSKWSGGHASNDPDVVPGILFSSTKLTPNQKPAIIDMAPTILSVFGAPTGGMDGVPLEFAR